MKRLSRIRLLECIENMRDVKVLVAGDFMVDKYVWGSVNRISPEAPVPVLVVDREEYRPGGAGNVAANIGKLGGISIALGLCGNDQAAIHLLSALDERAVRADGIVQTDKRPTTLKCRVVAHGQQLVRLDTEATTGPEQSELRALISRAEHLITEAGAVVLQDYNKGTLTKELITVMNVEYPSLRIRSSRTSSPMRRPRSSSPIRVKWNAHWESQFGIIISFSEQDANCTSVSTFERCLSPAVSMG
jgi:bifunctional ADP-heptose synthase (sugar kinase/adenylyltransferase)